MSPLPDLLPIKPFTRSVRGEVTLPGSKSITNRALLLAALCDGPVTLIGALFSEDTEIMAESLRRLGFVVEENAPLKTIRIEGRGGNIPAKEADLFVGNAGTAARFLTALCAAPKEGIFRLDGVPQMRKRPMKGLIDALRTLGADIRCTGEEGFFPLEIHAHGLRGGAVKIDASQSSQMLSALFMVAPLADSPVEIALIGTVRTPFVLMTSNLMARFGQQHFGTVGFNSFRISNDTRYTCTSPLQAIDPDATAASYYAALPLVVGGSLLLKDLRWGIQGDTDFLSVLGRVGATGDETHEGFVFEFSCGSPRKGVTENFSEFSDTFLTLAAIAPLLDGPTRITGIAHTRKQETDRVAGMARELTRLGQRVIETEDSLEIHPQPLRAGQTIETYGDHRFAMSFAILGCHDLHGDGRPWLTIKDPACCAKTFPNFFEVLETVRQKSLEV